MGPSLLQVHVREKPPQSYNGWEQHVAQKMAKNDAGFLPRNTAIVLQAFEGREGAALQSLDGRMTRLAQRVETLFTEHALAMRRELSDALARVASGVVPPQKQTSVSETNFTPVWHM